MKYILKYGFIVTLIFIFFGCKFVPTSKELHFFNGNFTTKIIIIDRNNNKYEFDIEPEWVHMWSKDVIGDFSFIYIKTESELEGIFIISNNYNSKKSYEIISRKKYLEWTFSEYYNDDRVLLYEILIQPIENEFVIAYNDKYFFIQKYFSYDDNYLINKEKYFREYNLGIPNSSC